MNMNLLIAAPGVDKTFGDRVTSMVVSLKFVAEVLTDVLVKIDVGGT